MSNTYISYNDTQDPEGCAQGPDHYQEASRDPERTPFQWDDSDFAGDLIIKNVFFDTFIVKKMLTNSLNKFTYN